MRNKTNTDIYFWILLLSRKEQLKKFLAKIIKLPYERLQWHI